MPGVPGWLLVLTAVDPDETVVPPPWQLLAVVLGAVVVIAALTAIPARLRGRRPVAATLRSEHA